MEKNNDLKKKWNIVVFGKSVDYRYLLDLEEYIRCFIEKSKWVHAAAFGDFISMNTFIISFLKWRIQASICVIKKQLCLGLDELWRLSRRKNASIVRVMNSLRSWVIDCSAIYIVFEWFSSCRLTGFRSFHCSKQD